MSVLLFSNFLSLFFVLAMKHTSIIITSFISATLWAWLMYFLTHNNSSENLLKQYYQQEVAVGVSPHHLRKHMKSGEYIIVDVRDEASYLKNHIKGAMNISADRDKETIIASFSQLPKEKTIVTYCYSSACMASKKIGKLLAEHGIFVKHLNVGWNEWRYDREMRNYPEEWPHTNVFDYVESGHYVPLETTWDVDDGACPVSNEALGC